MTEKEKINFAIKAIERWSLKGDGHARNMFTDAGLGRTFDSHEARVTKTLAWLREMKVRAE